MNDPDPNVLGSVVDAPPAPVTKKVAQAQLELLGGDEIIQLSIKPSLWYIPLVSLNVVVPMLLLAAAVAFGMRFGWNLIGTIVFQAALCIAAARVAIAALQWASRLYILTNRRVMRFRGVLNVEVADCPLARIREASLDVAWYQRLPRLGTIHITPAKDAAPMFTWDHLARPSTVYQTLIRAIRRAQSHE